MDSNKKLSGGFTMNQNLSRITGVAMLSLTLATVGAPIAQARV